jgi:hypothetical protein
MANDERQSETFIREVDEELRRDQLKALWKRFAPLIIGVCVLIVAITAGYRGWVWWQERKAAEAGDRFMVALTEIESGDRAKGEAELAAIAKDSDAGYAALARLRLAGEKAASDKAAAIAAYTGVADDQSVPEPLRDVARIRAALLALDTGDLKGAKDRAAPLNVAGNPWRHVAREVIGTAAYQAGDLQAARDAFTEIQQDAETPQDLWIRSGLMVSLIDGQLAAPAEASKAAPPSGSTPVAPPPPETASGASAPAPAGEPQTGASGAAPAELPVPTEGATGLSDTGMNGEATGAGPSPDAPGPVPSPAPNMAPVPAPDASGAPPTAPTP